MNISVSRGQQETHTNWNTNLSHTKVQTDLLSNQVQISNMQQKQQALALLSQNTNYIMKQLLSLSRHKRHQDVKTVL